MLYTKLFEKGFRAAFGRKPKGEKRRCRSLALKIIHFLDGRPEVRRDDLVQELRADHSNYMEKEIETVVKALHNQGLIVSQPGRYSRISIK